MRSIDIFGRRAQVRVGFAGPRPVHRGGYWVRNSPWRVGLWFGAVLIAQAGASQPPSIADPVYFDETPAGMGQVFLDGVRFIRIMGTGPLVVESTRWSAIRLLYR